MNKDEASTIKIIITFILLIIAIFAYITINKHMETNPTKTEENIVNKAKNSTLNEKDALKLGTEKYYLAVATITNTKIDIDKIYNVLEKVDLVLENKNLIKSLNEFNNKNYTINSSVELISNYDEAITKNFTEEIINKYILNPNGFIGKVNNDHYIINDKIDNYFFKEANLKLVSQSTNELYFKVINTNYKSTCAKAGSTTPSITCKDTKESSEKDFRLIKEDKNWKISEITITTN